MSKEKDEVYNVEPYNERSLAMSNVLISSKYKATVQELKVTYLALQKVQLGQYEKVGENVYITFSGKELQEAMGVKGHSFFTRLASTCEHMTGRTIGIVDPEKRRFMFIPFISLAAYSSGQLTVRFAPEMENYILNLDKNFTYLLKDTMMDFDREYSFKLYEVLKSYSFYPKDYKKPKNGKFQITLGLSELKLTIGIINAELDAVKDVLNKNKENPDYDKAVAVAPEKIYEDWSLFRRKVLIPATNEINEKTDIYVEFKPKTGGRGGKVVGVIFTVQDKQYESKEEIPPVELNKKEWSVVSKPSDEDRFAFVMEVLEAVSQVRKLSYPEGLSIAEACNYDIDYLNEKIICLKQQKKLDDDYDVTGFLIKACQDNFKPNTVKAGSGKKKIENGHFQGERDDDLVELENSLLSK